MKIRLVRAELYHADGRMDRHGGANSRFSQFCEKRFKKRQLLSPLHFAFCVQFSALCLRWLALLLPLC
jgi:hypothetical protein